MGALVTPLIQKAIGTLVRHGLTILGAWLVENGLTTGDDWMTLSMKASPILVSLVWSLWQKYGSTLLQSVLHDLPAGASANSIRNELAATSFSENVVKATTFDPLKRSSM